MPFDPQLEQAIAAHMQYLRDLGIFDFYRRSNPQFADEKADDEPVAISLAPQEPVIPPRKPAPLPPMVGSFVAPESRAEALRAIQYEIGDCTR
jgi:hypothetical protein